MAANLDVFKTLFINTYQELFQKRLVGKILANFRFQAGLSFGVSVDRAILDTSAIRIRDITPLADRTVDALGDTKETLTVDRIKGFTFAISEYELKQAGPLSPAVTAGGRVAKELALYVDGDILYEITNMTYDFDTGDLTTLSSNATPITLSSTTVPQMVARMPAKNSLKNNQDNEGTTLVIDSFAASDIAQYVMGKNIDLAGSTFKNGYSGTVGTSDVRVSEKLTAETVFTFTGQPSNGEVLTINGINFTAVTTIGSTAGNFLVVTDQDTTLTNLTALMNAPGTTNANQVALSAANQNTWTAMRVTATADLTANTLTLVAKGAGRLTITEAVTNFAVTTNAIHCYYGKTGFTDVVMQIEVDMDERQEPKQRTTNYMGDRMYGVKTFADGKVRGLDVLIAA
jgi:hypothetical protein